MWRWRKFKWWLGGVRYGAEYRDALRLIAMQGGAMERFDAGVWARETAKAALDCSCTEIPTPKLREAFALYKSAISN